MPGSPGKGAPGKGAPYKGVQQPPLFGPCLLWPRGWMDQDAIWYRGMSRPIGHIVLEGTQLLQKRHSSPRFLTHVYCGQTAGWIRMPFGMEVGLGPGHIMLDGDPATPPQKGPQFSAHVCCANGWVDQDAIWYGGRPRPRRHSVRWGSSCPQRGTDPSFQLMSVVAKLSPISATAELL